MFDGIPLPFYTQKHFCSFKKMSVLIQRFIWNALKSLIIGKQALILVYIIGYDFGKSENICTRKFMITMLHAFVWNFHERYF